MLGGVATPSAVVQLCCRRRRRQPLFIGPCISSGPRVAAMWRHIDDVCWMSAGMEPTSLQPPSGGIHVGVAGTGWRFINQPAAARGHLPRVADFLGYRGDYCQYAGSSGPWYDDARSNGRKVRRKLSGMISVGKSVHRRRSADLPVYQPGGTSVDWWRWH